MNRQASFVALSGGIGGAKLSLGLAEILTGLWGSDPSRPSSQEKRDAGSEGSDPRLTVVVNTGDDFEHLGLYVSPDVDTTLYTLAGVVNAETGWGRSRETWSFMQAVGELGGPTWFRLGDRDLATHVERTRRLAAGESLTAVTAHHAQRLGVGARVLPMADAPVRTVVESDAGTLAFQEYFVRDLCRPVVRGLRYDGASAAAVPAGVMAALSAPSLAGIIICPSNPWLSIDPILAIPGMRVALRASGAPVIAVSPIIGGKAVKGPTAKIMAELGLAPDVASIARHYGGLIDGIIVDTADREAAGRLPVPATVTNTRMHTLDDKVAVAHHCLAFCERLAGGAQPVASRRTAEAG